MDLDHFKRINDTYGHRAGDAYLQIFSNRLQQIHYDKKICMRISGDEFGLYLHGFASVKDADIANIWKEIESTVLCEPAMIGGVSIAIRCSAGMAVYGLDTKEIYDLIEYADFAMYQAKKQGKNTYQRFNRRLYREEKG
jgi:diguanylate cyclase (GGDEF)-like protein